MTKGISAHNSGLLEAAYDAFNKIIDQNPYSLIALIGKCMRQYLIYI